MRSSVIHHFDAKAKESSYVQHRLQRTARPADPDRRRLGDHQHLPELRLEREKAAVDRGGAAAAAARSDPVVLPRTSRQQDVTRATSGVEHAYRVTVAKSPINPNSASLRAVKV